MSETFPEAAGDDQGDLSPDNQPDAGGDDRGLIDEAVEAAEEGAPQDVPPSGGRADPETYTAHPPRHVESEDTPRSQEAEEHDPPKPKQETTDPADAKTNTEAAEEDDGEVPEIYPKRQPLAPWMFDDTFADGMELNFEGNQVIIRRAANGQFEIIRRQEEHLAAAGDQRPGEEADKQAEDKAEDQEAKGKEATDKEADKAENDPEPDKESGREEAVSKAPEGKLDKPEATAAIAKTPETPEPKPVERAAERDDKPPEPDRESSDNKLPEVKRVGLPVPFIHTAETTGSAAAAEEAARQEEFSDNTNRTHLRQADEHAAQVGAAFQHTLQSQGTESYAMQQLIGQRARAERLFEAEARPSFNPGGRPSRVGASPERQEIFRKEEAFVAAARTDPDSTVSQQRFAELVNAESSYKRVAADAAAAQHPVRITSAEVMGRQISNMLQVPEGVHPATHIHDVANQLTGGGVADPVRTNVQLAVRQALGTMYSEGYSGERTVDAVRELAWESVPAVAHAHDTLVQIGVGVNEIGEGLAANAGVNSV
jgi:hypothetical protein